MHAIRHVWTCLLSCAVLLPTGGHAATKVHVIAFGKWTSVQWLPQDAAGAKALTLKIRALVVDGRVKEYVIGSPHEVTDDQFAVRRVFRVNDSLSDETAPRWVWQRGGWLLVNRSTGHVAPINMPQFDALYSVGSWYRDYVAYCGVSDEGKKISAIVVQIGRRKPVLNKLLASDGIPEDAGPDSACSTPDWQKNPARISFESAGSPRQTFAIRGHVVDVVSDEEEEPSR